MTAIPEDVRAEQAVEKALRLAWNMVRCPGAPLERQKCADQLEASLYALILSEREAAQREERERNEAILKNREAVFVCALRGIIDVSSVRADERAMCASIAENNAHTPEEGARIAAAILQEPKP